MICHGDSLVNIKVNNVVSVDNIHLPEKDVDNLSRRIQRASQIMQAMVDTAGFRGQIKSAGTSTLTNVYRRRDLVSDVSWCEVRGVQVVRHQGDPVKEYRDAVNTVAVRDRSHRGRIRVDGKTPVAALQGILTGRMPVAPVQSTEVVWKGKSFYSAVLTPKARVVTDLRIMWGSHHAEQETLFLDVPYIGLTPFIEYLRRTVPPRLATFEDITEETGLLSFVGPEATKIVAKFLLGSNNQTALLNDCEHGDYLLSNLDGGDIRIVRMEEVSVGGWNVFSSKKNVRDLWARLKSARVQAFGASVWEILRVEAGVPAFGQDIGDANIFPETGLVDKAVDHNKGCYTGQEIVVRVRDRGRINRLLSGFCLHGEILPKIGEKLFVGDREVGWLTSIVQSPRAGGTVALGYVRQDLSARDIITVGPSSEFKATAISLCSNWLDL